MHDETDTIKELHATFLGLGGIGPSFNMQQIFAWEIWMLRFNRDDLVFYMKQMCRKVAKGERNKGALKWTNAIRGDLDRFEEDLAMFRSEARANARKPVYGEREKILEATGRSIQPAKEAVHIGAVDWRSELNKMKKEVFGK